MRHTKLLFSAVAALAAAACADRAPTTAPSLDGGSPRLARAGHGPDVMPGARFISGNIAGDGNAVCANIAVNPARGAWGGVKVDPPRSLTIAGYQFTLSADGRTLSFMRVAPGPDIVAVVVKGGPDTFVFDFPAGTTSGTGLRAPRNGGGNVPEISHFTVCFTPPSGEHDWTVKKEILGYFLDQDMSGGLVPSSTITLPGFCTGDPKTQGCVIWVQYQITVTKSPGNFPVDQQALFTDNVLQQCAALAAATGGGIVCEFPANAAPVVQVNLDGSTTFTYFIDFLNQRVCGQSYTFTNTATVTESGPLPPGGEVRTSAATLTINTPACQPGQSFP